MTCLRGPGVMGGGDNEIHLITPAGVESWDRMSKHATAEALSRRIAEALNA